MPNEIKQYPGSPKSPLQACFKNVVRDLNQKIFVVRGFSLVHDPEGSHYENLKPSVIKRSMVDVGKNLICDCEVLLYRCGGAFPLSLRGTKCQSNLKLISSGMKQKSVQLSVVSHQGGG